MNSTGSTRLDDSSVDPEIAPLVSPVHDEIGARRRDEKLALDRGQKLEQRARALGIELARYVVEKQDGKHAARLRDAHELGTFERERDGAMLSLRCDDARGATVEHESEIVEVRTESRPFPLCVLTTHRTQALERKPLFFRAAGCITRFETEPRSGNPPEGLVDPLRELLACCVAGTRERSAMLGKQLLVGIELGVAVERPIAEQELAFAQRSRVTGAMRVDLRMREEG